MVTVSPRRAAGASVGTISSIVGYGGTRLGTTSTPRSPSPRMSTGSASRVALRASIRTTVTTYAVVGR